MKMMLRILTINVSLVLAGCAADPDQALFVTSTKIGVGADVAENKAHIGYDRTEAYIGPAYSDIGALPPVAGSLQSDLDIFAPEVRQTYATGDAALIATRRMNPKAVCPSEKSVDEIDLLSPREKCACNLGCPAGARRLAVFGTNTHVGLSVQAKETNIASVHFGYGRQELSVLPLNEASREKDGTVKSDYYGSTLAYINTDTDVAEGGVKPGTKLKLNQFVATGGAADALASTDVIRNSFDTLAKAGAAANANAAVRSLQLALTEEDAKRYGEQGTRTARNREADISQIISKFGLVDNHEVKITGADRQKIAEKLRNAPEQELWANDILGAVTVGELRKNLRNDEGVRVLISNFLNK